ncbi:MAG TPA: hypothetical protein VER78_03955 [Thermoanaerobaculia bacterium]|nr:hypothetical protein [Thermoanaerobaculia bacterium]
MRIGSGIWAKRAGLLALAGVIFAANLAFFLWYRGTARDRASSLEARRGALARDVEARESELSTLAGQRDRLAQVSSAINDFYEHRVGAQRKMLAAVVDEIHTVLKNAGVPASDISYATAPLQNLPLTEMRVSFGFKGDYARFKQLLAAFEADRRWIVVREIGISRIPDVPGAVQVHVGLVTYFSRETEMVAPRVSLRGGAAR